jgi:hypothetical protein
MSLAASLLPRAALAAGSRAAVRVDSAVRASRAAWSATSAACAASAGTPHVSALRRLGSATLSGSSHRAASSPIRPFSSSGAGSASGKDGGASSSGRGGDGLPDSAHTHPSGLTLVGGPGAGMGLDIPASRPSYYQPGPLNAFARRHYYLLNVMGVFSQKARVGAASEALYRSIDEQATQSAWWTALGLPRTWIAEHALIAMHVWVFHNRFKVDYNVGGEFSGRRMQEQLFERLWEDTTLRIRNAGVSCGGS